MSASDHVHILLIEDDEVDREAVRRLLENGWRLDEAPTAAAGQALLVRHRPDCILLDYRLPDADGLEVLPEMVATGVPVVMLTGQGNDDVAVASMRLGAHYYLEKDAINRSSIRRAVRVALEMAALRNTLAERNRELLERTREAESRAAQLRSFARALTTAEQEARRRLADSLHNHLQQLLTAAIVRLGRVRRRVAGDGAEALLEAIHSVEELLHDSIDETRNLTIELSPPILRHSGLAAALSWLGQWMKETHELTVHTHLADDADSDVPEVRTFVFEAVRELLFNVVKHSSVNEAYLSLAVDEGARLRISVRDHGTGCDPALLEHKKQRCESFGIFSIAERIEVFGGHCVFETSQGEGFTAVLSAPIQVESDQGAACQTPAAAPDDRTHQEHGMANIGLVSAEPGSRVSLDNGSGSMPATDAAAAAAGAGRHPRRSVPVPGVPVAANERPRIRVLLADDHRIVRQGLVSLLEEQDDLEVVAEAHDGAEAVEMARHCHPDAIVLDVNMPRMNGIEACRIISRELPDTSIIGLSVNNDDATAQAMYEAGAMSYLKKDGPAEELWAAIRRAAAARRPTA